MGLGTGALIVLATRKPVINVVSSPIFNNNNLPIFNNDNSSLVNFGGRSTKIVKRLSDGKIWEKASLAAAEAGVDAAYMSRHLNGKKPDIFGETYKIVGIATTG
jgi:hypothetical protein